MPEKIVKCKACNKDVSTTAKSCPGCGSTSLHEEAKAKGCAIGCLTIFILSILITLIWECSDGGQTDTKFSVGDQIILEQYPDTSPLYKIVKITDEYYIVIDKKGNDTHRQLKSIDYIDDGYIKTN